MNNNRHNFQTQPREITIPFRGQEFHKLRDSCLRQKILFEDPYFYIDRKYNWKRPFEICDSPRLFVEGPSRKDVMQGSLGDCWLLAGMSALAMQFDLVRRVIPDDQSFVYEYAGIFHFHLWQFGKWYDVVVDDRLPTDQNGHLAFLHSSQENEFWAALLEKAYCKVSGGFYTVAEAGNLCEGLEDFTGGVVEQFNVKSAPRNFDKILLKSYVKKTLMGCFMDASPSEIENRRPDGLMKGHSYSITSVIAINVMPYGNITLIRIRNPWGDVEWNGPWSDGSPEWRSVPYETREELGLTFEDDGEFWMSYYDFIKCWDWVDMCHLSPDAYEHNANKKLDWHMNSMRGSWVRGITDGGKKRMYMNPQIRVTLTDADDEDEDGYCSVLIALLQRVKGPEKTAYNEIGIKVYSINDSEYITRPLDQPFFHRNRPVAQTVIRATREVAGRFNLLPGNYCIIPYTYNSGKEGDFLLRVFTEQGHDMSEMNDKIGLKPTDLRLSEAEDIEDKVEEVSEVDKEVKHTELKDFFDKTTGGDMEADWRELKIILDHLVKKENIKPNENSNFFSKILTSLTKIFTEPVTYGSAYETIDAAGFSKDLCRSMIALVDMDHSGKVSFQEFQDLWSGILKWKSIYEIYSKDSEGILSSGHLKDALSTAGFNLNNKVLGDLVHRYATNEGNIGFDDFLHCALKLSTMADYFKSKNKENKEMAEFTLEEFISKTLYS